MLKNATKAGSWGFIKCMYDPKGMAAGYAKDKIVAKLPQKLSKSINIVDKIDGIVSCFFEC